MIIALGWVLGCTGCAGYLLPDPGGPSPERGGIKLDHTGAAAVELLGHALEIGGPFIRP